MKNLALLLLISFASCKKESVNLPAPPETALIQVNSVTRICSGINCNQILFNYSVSRPELLNSITFNYGNSIGVPVISLGNFKTFSTPSTITGYFELKHKYGKIIRTETKSYL